MKTVLITGGGRGLGRETAMRLASLGHRVILTAHDAASAEASVAAIRAASPGAQVEGRVLELASLAALRAFAGKVLDDGLSLDVLFHCAGVLTAGPTRRLTVDGWELTLAVNALAPLVLTRALEPALRRTPAPRVVNVSSRLHLPGSRGAPVHFDFADPQLAEGYHPERAYKNSKLALLWVTFELARRLAPGVSVNAVCPGFVPTTAAHVTSGAMRWAMEHVLPHLPFARTVDEAVDSFCFMALDPSLDGVSGRFYGERQPIEASEDARDAAKAARFCALAERLTDA